jgi:glycosyltransferase involved in cell wall biosynthesis
MMLLHLMRWLKEHSDFTFEIVSVVGGPLMKEYASLGRSVALDETWAGRIISTDWLVAQAFTHKPNMLTRAAARLTWRLRRWAIRRQLGDVSRFSLIYANSSASAAYFSALPSRRPPLITHVHELAHSLRHLMPPGAIEAMLKGTRRFIACSEGVRQTLVSNYEVPADDITVCHEPVVGEDLDRGGGHDRTSVLAELDIPEGALIVGGAGAGTWRKGTDLFGIVASSIRKQLSTMPIFFVWVGGFPVEVEDRNFRYDFEKLELSDRLRLVDTVVDPYRYFAMFDVLALTSREDPFPLVALEVSAMAIPVVAFDSGGITEMLPPEAGAVVPYADTEEMKRRIVELLQDSELRAMRGAVAAQWVRSHYDIKIIGPQILSVIEATRAPAHTE